MPLNKGTMMKYLLNSSFLLIIILSGCAQSTPATTYPTTGNVGRLIKDSDFQAAKKAAPIFTQDALRTVQDLQYQNGQLKAPTN